MTNARDTVPLPRLKPRSMYMQTTKANKARDDLSYKLYEHLLRANESNREPAPFMRTKEEGDKYGLSSSSVTHTNSPHGQYVLSVCKTSS